jgi:transcriptional regulator
LHPDRFVGMLAAVNPSNSKGNLHMTEKATVTVSKTIKAKLAADIASRMKRGKVSQSELARRMKTSRAVVHRLLNAADTSLTLATLASVATALKTKVRITVGG